ncbi:MAG: Fe-S-containing protein, partial [Actinobacteria bacterium]|nr:Fe-S-containing protein [Actinomycetota bacterium]
NQKNTSAQGLGLMAFTFLMVFREGAETVLFLMGSTLGRFDILSFIGGGLGIGLAVLFAVFFIRGSLRINLSRFFTVTSIVLILLAFKLLVSGLHEYAERGLMLLTPGIMTFIGFFVRDKPSTLFLIVLLMVPLIIILWDTRTLKPVSRENTVSTVEKRKLVSARRQERIWRISLILASLFIIFAMGWIVLAGGPGYDDPQPIPVKSADGKVRVPIAELPEGKLVKYAFDADGTQVRFLLVRLNDNSISSALDVCRICGSVGYGQGSETAICKKCNAPIALDTIGQGGGCNPLPLAASTDGEKVVFEVEELIKGKEEF